nr:MAG TPA: Single strand binding protein [Caudoviricetes sp.]
MDGRGLPARIWKKLLIRRFDMLNKIFVMGRLTKDPELRRTNNGTAVASFALAVDRDFKNADGTKDTDFIDIVAWRGTAEFASKYFTKGRMAVVDGRLQMRDWQDKNGNNRRSAEIVADNMYFGDSRKDMDAHGTFPRTDGKSQFVEMDEDDSDLPF